MQISQSIFLEFDFFLKSFLMGIVLLVLYDLLRVTRRVLRQPDGLVALVDVLYWCVAGVLLFLLSMDENDGLIRAYALLATGMGMLLYNRTVSSFFIKIFSRAGLKIKKIITILAKKLLFLKKRLKKKEKEGKI